MPHKCFKECCIFERATERAEEVLQILKKNNEAIVGLAKNVKNELQKLGLGRIIFENTGNIGKSYRKHDEIGTPVCITIDFESLENKSVTVRDRDSMIQSRVDIKSLSDFVTDKIRS